MTLGPDPAERLARARAELAIGLPVRLVADGVAWLAAAAERLPATRLAAMTGGGDALLALSTRRARTLRLAPYFGDLALLSLPARPDPGWLVAVADPSQDLDWPLKGPFRSRREGPEGIARAALALARGARLLPAVVLAPDRDEGQITTLDAADVLAGPAPEPAPTEVTGALLPLAGAETARLHLFRTADDGGEHVALEVGQPDRAAPVLTRLHSACFTGDVLGSLKCDCGPQLRAAMAAIVAEGAGLLLYLDQEGRGIGLANKMRAYALQDLGFDTVEANHRLGFEDDERDFHAGAGMLQRLGIGRVRLLSNNPRKVSLLTEAGIEVTERVPLAVGRTSQNAHYLDTKARKSGHLL